MLAGVGSPFTWTIHHRHHHKYSDKFENGKTKDLHSPHDNKWRSILGTWAIMDLSWWIDEKQVKTLPKDLMRDPTVTFIHNHYYKMWASIFLASLIFGGWQFCLFLLCSQ